MKCPFCQGVIDDDSRYCDLCGKHLMFCPECRQPKKGTSCPRCGELLISAEEFFGAKVAVNSKPSDSLSRWIRPRDRIPPSHWKKLISTRYSMPC